MAKKNTTEDTSLKPKAKRLLSTITSKHSSILQSILSLVYIQLIMLVSQVSNFKLTVLQNTTVTLDCGTGGGIAIGGWIKPISESINYAVDEGTRTGNSLNLFKEATPSFGTALTKKVGPQWVYTAMHWNSGCAAQGFYRSNNADLIAITAGTSLKFSTIFSI